MSERVTGEAHGAEAGTRVSLSRAQAQELERTALFQALPRRQRQRVAALAEVRHFADGEAIVSAGGPGDSLYFLLDGGALVATPDGRERALALGDHFGELSLIDGAPRAATVFSSGPATLARISRADFYGVLDDDPSIALGLLPGLTLVVRDVIRSDAACIPDHSCVRDWRTEGDAAVPSEAPGEKLDGRDALGWLLLLRHVDLFQALPEHHLRRVASLFSVKRFADGATVTVAGARGDSMHVILNGRARVRTPSGHTRSLGEDDCFGELALLDGAPRAATVSAVGELTTAVVGRTAFQKLMRSEPGVAVGLLHGLTRTVRELQGEKAV